MKHCAGHITFNVIKCRVSVLRHGGYKSAVTGLFSVCRVEHTGCCSTFSIPLTPFISLCVQSAVKSLPSFWMPCIFWKPDFRMSPNCFSSLALHYLSLSIPTHRFSCKCFPPEPRSGTKPLEADSFLFSFWWKTTETVYDKEAEIERFLGFFSVHAL